MNENIPLSNFRQTIMNLAPTSDPPSSGRNQDDQNETNESASRNNKLNVHNNISKRCSRLRRELRYNFLSYGDKWKVNHKPQGKLIYQFIKTIFVIIQLYCISIDIAKLQQDVDTIKVGLFLQ